jgi:hypothetical protein
VSLSIGLLHDERSSLVQVGWVPTNAQGGLTEANALRH